MMKQLLFAVFLFTGLQSGAQNATKVFDAIGKGDVNTISSLMQNDVELCFDTSQDFFTKREAVSELTAFFNKIKPVSCKYLHKGSSKDNRSAYSVGELNSKSGKFRVFLYMEANTIVGISFYPA